MRAALESLLRARKLDVTLTLPDEAPPPDRFAPTGDAPLDAALGGGLRRGHVSEIVGAPSTGRTSLMVRALAAAADRGEAVALADARDTFDPASAAAHGLALARLLWVRPSLSTAAAADVEATRALKAFSLMLQAGGFGLVVLDLADVPLAVLRRCPWYRTSATWMRLARSVEGTDTVALVVGGEHVARSSGGATIACDAVPGRWQGTADRARVFAGVDPSPRVVSAR
ncbi:MAG TPA: hypothetical protein VFK57_01015 [Vicinamibacterales bacterium]|nr:hypothetical protein [Vicinamibacterales bacterium]